MTFLIKLFFDVAVAGAVLTVSAPFLALIAVAIKLEDKGPILFVQDRVGKAGRLFRCYKFRTMGVGAEGEGSGLTVTADDPLVTGVKGSLTIRKPPSTIRPWVPRRR